MRITIQARTQGTFEVEEFSDRGFRATFRPPMGPGRRSDGGRRRRSPRKLIDFYILHIYRVVFLVSWLNELVILLFNAISATKAI